MHSTLREAYEALREFRGKDGIYDIGSYGSSDALYVFVEPGRTSDLESLQTQLENAAAPFRVVMKVMHPLIPPIC